MRSIAFLSQKGGSGKTTLAVHIAVAAESTGERVTLIDADPQGSASAWSQAREENRPQIAKVTASSIGRAFERAAQERITLAVIDTAPHAVPGVDIIASTADFLLRSSVAERYNSFPQTASITASATLHPLSLAHGSPWRTEGSRGDLD
jgi:chromosome partitioning protein